MPSFLPRKRVRETAAFPVLACRLDELFEHGRYKPSVDRVISYIHKIYVGYSDGSYERVSRPETVTEQFYFAMPTLGAYLTEVELVNAIHAHALGNLTDENIKVYLQKYLEAHTFIYRWVDRTVRQFYKTENKNTWTGREVPLYRFEWLPLKLGSTCVLNAIQAWLYPRLEALSGNNAQYRTIKL